MGAAQSLGGGSSGESRRVLVLLNPTAGQGRRAARIQKHLAEFASEGLELIVPNPADHLEQLEQAETAVKTGVDAVLVLGGDGMVHTGVQLVAGRQIPMGLVPTGTGNDFARGAGVPRHPTMRNLLRLLHQLSEPELTTKAVDALRVRITQHNGTSQHCWAANAVNIGFDARVNQRANQLKKVPGPMRYLVALTQVIPSFQAKDFHIAVDGQPAQLQPSALVCLQNGPFIGGGIPLAPGAQPADGRLDLSWVQPLSRPGLVALFPLLMIRLHRVLKPLRTEQHRGVVVTVPPQVPVYADGDELLAGADSECQVEVTVEPETLRLLT
ncbi:diacylglycerol/lipid kinase family protein [Nesterenkonia ebinurensis]|uniref:diacylglycerol/lipid kinase family protein n=1 Tax=Nesterenkonia ebinurensis TaxID=2608252 RepID=UPI00123E249A|nr:diacylglycerol kinase family protein [Nesterenkonia ebinurensis]